MANPVLEEQKVRARRIVHRVVSVYDRELGRRLKVDKGKSPAAIGLAACSARRGRTPEGARHRTGPTDDPVLNPLPPRGSQRPLRSANSRYADPNAISQTPPSVS